MIDTNSKIFSLLLALLLLTLLPVKADADSFDQAEDILKLQSSSLWRGVNNLVIENGLIYALHKSGFAVYKPDPGFLDLDTLAMVPLEHEYENSFKLFNEYMLYNYSGEIGFVFVKNPENSYAVAESNLGTSFLDADYESLYLYLACGFDGVQVYSLYGRDSPVLVAKRMHPAHTVAVWLYDDYLYAIDDYNGIFIYDISISRRSPAFIGKKLFEDQLVDMVTIGETAYCANTDGGLVLLDMSDPVDPQFIRRFETETEIKKVEVSGGYVFASDAFGNYEVYHPDSIEQVTYLDRLTLRTAPQIVEDISGKFLAAVDTGAAAGIYRLGDDWERRELIRIGDVDRLKDFTVYNDMAFIASGEDDLIRMDISSDKTAVLDGYYPARVDLMQRYDNLLFMADNNNYQLWVSQINASRNISTENLIPFENKAVALAAGQGSDASVNVALYTEDKIYLHNIDNENLRINSSVEIDDLENMSAGMIYADYLYAVSDSMLSVYDISNPSMPFFSWEYQWPGMIKWMQVSDFKLFTAGNFGLMKNHIHGGQPGDSINSFAYEGCIEHFILDNDYAYCAAGEDGLLAFDLKMGASIWLMDNIETPGFANRVELIDSALFVNDSYGFLKYYVSRTGEFPDPEPVSVPRRFELSQNYPNPFNQSTLIKVNIPASAKEMRLEIEIFNGLGQKVRTLASESVNPGQRVYRWNGCDDNGDELASGIYFYRCRLGGIEESRKMLLLK
ncbi:MAG: T9SS type A sorting domain-containing protein [candidate division Zixibacteria bacterium]|nr:T9SS type A sorting domain-containing protein [candidate division Zixibacteria bacterium]